MKQEEIIPPAFAKAMARQAQPLLRLRGGDILTSPCNPFQRRIWQRTRPKVESSKLKAKKRSSSPGSSPPQ